VVDNSSWFAGFTTVAKIADLLVLNRLFLLNETIAVGLAYKIIYNFSKGELEVGGLYVGRAAEGWEDATYTRWNISAFYGLFLSGPIQSARGMLYMIPKIRDYISYALIREKTAQLWPSVQL